VDESIKQQEKTVEEIKQKRESLLERRISLLTARKLTKDLPLTDESLEIEITQVDEELKIETDKYVSIKSKKTEMQEQRVSLREQHRRTRRPVSIVVKSTADINDPFIINDTPSSLRPSTHVPYKAEPNRRSFVLAWEALWSSLVQHSGPYLLEEGIKRAKNTRGFWLVSYPSAQSLIDTWKSGAQMAMDYIEGSYEQVKYYSGGDEGFMNSVLSFNLNTTVCFIMVVDLSSSFACSWGTIDVNGVNMSNLVHKDYDTTE